MVPLVSLVVSDKKPLQIMLPDRREGGSVAN